jgi:hypothetical protein
MKEASKGGAQVSTKSNKVVFMLAVGDPIRLRRRCFGSISVRTKMLRMLAILPGHPEVARHLPEVAGNAAQVSMQ